MEQTNELQNKNEPDMFGYRFISLDVMKEKVEIFEIVAGCESDAFDLVNERADSNSETIRILTDNMVKQIYDEVQKVKDIV